MQETSVRVNVIRAQPLPVRFKAILPTVERPPQPSLSSPSKTLEPAGEATKSQIYSYSPAFLCFQGFKLGAGVALWPSKQRAGLTVTGTAHLGIRSSPSTPLPSYLIQ